MDDLQERQVSLNDYMQLLYRGRWIILTSFLAVMLSTVYFTFTVDPVYEASAKVMIKEEGGMESALFGIGGFMKKETMINNQVEILRSRTLAEAVIKELENSEFAAQLQILHPEIKVKSGLMAGVGKWFSDLFGRKETPSELSFDDIVESLRGRISVNPIRQTDMIELKVTAGSPEEAAFITNTLAAAYNETNRLASQEEVHQVKNFLAEQLQTIQKELVESEEALKAYKENEKVVALSSETEELIKKLAEFETLYNEALTELNSSKERLNYIDTQLANSKANFDIKTISSTPYFEEIRKQIADIEGKKAVFLAGLVNEGLFTTQGQAAKDPQIRRYDEQIEMLTANMKAELAKLAKAEIPNPIALNEDLFLRKIEVEASLQALHPKVGALKKIVDDYNRQLEALPEKSLKLARLERTARVDEKLYLMMQEKFEESRITEVGQLGNVRLVDTARAPKYPIKPRKKMNMILGAIIGLGLGIGLTFLLEYLDNSVRTIEDVERLGLTVLGSIPRITEEEAVRRMKVLPAVNGNGNGAAPGQAAHQEARRIAARLITHFAPKAPISEAYRAFRTNIQYTKLDNPLKAILVTSPGPAEGKSTSVANLAITMAQMGSKVLVVDSDLRRPILHSIFQRDKKMGLTNVLVGRSGLEDAIQKTEIDNLYLLTSGPLPPNPSELLGSSAMRQVLEGIKKTFDVALFDSPPIIAVTDAAVLSSIVDGVILVINSGQTDRQAAVRAHAMLNNLNTRVLGALLNGVDIENMYGSYYYYYHYYYYGKDGETSRRGHKRTRSGSHVA